MPNNVKNFLHMEGITSLPVYERGGEGGPSFDFKKIIPMPESLNVTSDTLEDIAIEAAVRKVEKALSFKEWSISPSLGSERYKQRLSITRMSEEELLKQGLVYITNILTYGASSWYEWCIANWGTKWNAYTVKEEDVDIITFETAWSSPDPVIRKLSEMYPGVLVEHWWADEDTGSNTGHAVYLDGQAVEYVEYPTNSQEAFETVIKCWGEKCTLAKDENGQWYYRGCEGCHGCD